MSLGDFENTIEDLVAALLRIVEQLDILIRSVTEKTS